MVPVSTLLAAARGLINLHEPVPGIVTGGQPSAAQLAALKAAGCRVVLDIRDPMEPRPLRTPQDIEALGLEYVNIPVGHGGLPPETFGRVRDALQRVVREGKATLFHCASGNRVGATMIPYLMLDREMNEDDAMTEAMKMGARSAELVELALAYVRAQRP